MKHFNENHEAIISTEMKPVTTEGYKGGDMVPHNQKVTEVVIYQWERGNYRRVQLDRSFIMDISKQIEEIENLSAINIEWDDIPF